MIEADPEPYPHPDEGIVLEEYATGRLNQIYRNRKHIRAQMIILERLHLLDGGWGLLLADPIEITTWMYSRLSESRRGRHIRDAIARIEDFREWHAKHYPAGSLINSAYRGCRSVSGKPDITDNQKQRPERDDQTREERGDD